MKNMKTKRSAAMTIKASVMKYGWHQMVNNTVHHYQTPYAIALIVEKLSNYNSILREQIEMDEDEIQQNYKSSDVNRYESKLSASETSYFPKRIEEKCKGNYNAFNNN